MNRIIQHFQAWFNHDTALINNPNPLLVLAVILVVGYICSRLARKLHIPVVTAQIVGGVLLANTFLISSERTLLQVFEQLPTSHWDSSV